MRQTVFIFLSLSCSSCSHDQVALMLMSLLCSCRSHAHVALILMLIVAPCCFCSATCSCSGRQGRAKSWLLVSFPYMSIGWNTCLCHNSGCFVYQLVADTCLGYYAGCYVSWSLFSMLWSTVGCILILFSCVLLVADLYHDWCRLLVCQEIVDKCLAVLPNTQFM